MDLGKMKGRVFMEQTNDFEPQPPVFVIQDTNPKPEP